MSERTQVKLVLTSDMEVLNALRRNGVMKTNPKTKEEYLALQFDSAHFHFYPDKELVVPGPVAEGLYRSSGVLIGDAMSGTQQPGILKLESWELGEQEPSRRASKTTCPICMKDMSSKKELVAHMAVHSEEKEEE